MTGIARAALLIVLSGAATSLIGAAPAGTTGFTVLNQRPPKEKKDRLWSVWIWNCNFGVSVADALAPP